MPSAVMGGATSGGSSTGEQLLTGASGVTVDLNTTAAQDLYEVLPGKTLAVTRAVLRENGSAELDGGSLAGVTIIRSSDGGTIIGLAVTTVNDYVLGAPSAQTGRSVAATTKAQFKAGTAYGSAATAVVDLFGYTF